jgi:hypothetical protein
MSKAILETVEHHLAKGEAAIIEQRFLIARLRQRGQPIAEAERVLRMYEDVQQQNIRLLSLIREEASSAWH